MSWDAYADWYKFRELTKEYFERLKRDFPEEVRKDNIVILRNSYRKFKIKFPTSMGRDNAIRYLRIANERETKK